MSKDYREFIGEVLETLPNAEFRVKLKEKPVEILAYLSGKMRMNYIKILTGDTVKLEISPYNPTKGRIIFREKK